MRLVAVNMIATDTASLIIALNSVIIPIGFLPLIQYVILILWIYILEISVSASIKTTNVIILAVITLIKNSLLLSGINTIHIAIIKLLIINIDE